MEKLEYFTYSSSDKNEFIVTSFLKNISNFTNHWIQHQTYYTSSTGKQYYKPIHLALVDTTVNWWHFPLKFQCSVSQKKFMCIVSIILRDFLWTVSPQQYPGEVVTAGLWQKKYLYTMRCYLLKIYICTSKYKSSRFWLQILDTIWIKPIVKKLPGLDKAPCPRRILQ